MGLVVYRVGSVSILCRSPHDSSASGAGGSAIFTFRNRSLRMGNSGRASFVFPNRISVVHGAAEFSHAGHGKVAAH